MEGRGTQAGLSALVVGMLASGCTPTGTPELTLTASPHSIRANGAKTKVTVLATTATGSVGSGTVNLKAAAGSLKEGVDLTLDSFGAASAEVSCDTQVDPLCDALTSLRVVGTWLVTGELRVTIDPPAPDTESVCGNNFDDDEDGLIDCRDPDCDALPCEDGQLCTVGEVCGPGASGICSGGMPRTCTTPPNTFCASGAGTCDPSLGCVYPPQNLGQFCDDGSMCTVNDRCDANGRCTGSTVTCSNPPGHPACFIPRCSPSRGCEYTKRHDGTSCGPRAADRCCGGWCVGVDESSSNCGGCGVVCPRYCYDAVSPAGCGPAIDVTGRCVCSGDGDCPGTQVCILGVCSPTVCRPYETKHVVSADCPAFCRY